MGILRSLVREDLNQAAQPPIIILVSLWLSLLTTLPFIGNSPSAEVLLWYHEFGRYDPSAMDGVIWNIYIWQKFQVVAGVIIGSLPWVLPKIVKSSQFLILGPYSLSEQIFPKIRRVLLLHLLLAALAGLSTLCVLRLLASSFSLITLVQLIVLGLLTMIWTTVFTVLLQILIGNPLCSLFVSLSALTTLSHPSLLIRLNGLNPLSLSMSIISSGTQNNVVLFATHCILLLGFVSFTLVAIYITAERLHERTAIQVLKNPVRLRTMDVESQELLRYNAISAAVLIPLSLIYIDFYYLLVCLYGILTYWSISSYFISAQKKRGPDSQAAALSQFLLLTPSNPDYMQALGTRREIKGVRHLFLIPHLIVLTICLIISESTVYFALALFGVVLSCEITLAFACLAPQILRTRWFQPAFIACSLLSLTVTLISLLSLIGLRALLFGNYSSFEIVGYITAVLGGTYLLKIFVFLLKS